MLDIPTRRGFIRVGAASLIGLSLPDYLKSAALATPKARSVIQIWLAGGPTQTDTFDPKPNASEDYTGPLRRPISTNVAGMQLGELLPMLAKQADKFTIIRSMTHGNNAHETAAYIMQTGSMPTAELVYPAVGAIVALKKADQTTLPPYITRSAASRNSVFLAAAPKPSLPAATPITPTFACKESCRRAA